MTLLRLRVVHSLRVEAAKRRHQQTSEAEVAELKVPQEALQGTVGQLVQWFANEGACSASARLGVDGYALLPQQPAALLRQGDELMICAGPEPPAPRSRASPPALPAPAQPADEPAKSPAKPPAKSPAKPPAKQPKAAKPAKQPGQADPQVEVRGAKPGDLEELVKAQARRIQELEEQNAMLQRKLAGMSPERSWRPVPVDELRKGSVICYQLDLIDAWKQSMQRSLAKVAVITKISRGSEGQRSFVLRCESGGVDFVEASCLRNVQIAS